MKTETAVPDDARAGSGLRAGAPLRRNNTRRDVYPRNRNMNTLEITNVALHAENTETMPIEVEPRQQSAAVTRQPMPKAKRDAPARYALLIFIALLAGWLGVFVHNTINEMNAHMEATRVNLLLPH